MSNDPKLPERETYTAKQIATRIGTDAKTLRKFFRSASSTVDPVGQGGRYEFDAALLPQIRKEFGAWKNRGAARSAGKAVPKHVEVIEEDDQVVDFDDEEEPDDMSLDELADLVEELQVQDDEWNTGAVR